MLPVKLNLRPAADQPFLGWRIASMALLGVLASSFIGSSYFIYRYVYRTLQDAHVILELSANPDAEALNRRLLEQALRLISQKNTTFVVPRAIRNVFEYGPATTTTATAPSARSRR